MCDNNINNNNSNIQCIFGVSPNWYRSHSIIWMSDNTVLYVARHYVVVMDIQQHTLVHHQCASASHKLEAVCAYYDQDNALVVVCGDSDGRVASWQAIDGRLNKLMEWPVYRSPVSALVCAKSGNCIVCGHRDGRLVVSVNGVFVERMMESGVECVAIETLEERVAVGTTSGRVHVVKILRDDIAQGNDTHLELLYSCGSNDDAHTPVLGVHWNANSNELVSVCRGGFLYVWDVNGKCSTRLKLPKKRGNKKDPKKEWIASCWPAWSDQHSRAVYLVSGEGDLYSWNLDSTEFAVSLRKIHAVHLRQAFGLVWCAIRPGRLISHSMDRTLVEFDTNVGRKGGMVVSKLMTLGGFVHSLSTCPHNSGVVAMGCGDNRMIIVDNSSKSTRVIWRDISDPVKIVKWHPTVHDVVAYACDSGHVCVYDIRSEGGSWTPSSQDIPKEHRGAVVSLCWIRTNERDDQWILLTCTSGGVVCEHKLFPDDKSWIIRVVPLNHLCTDTSVVMRFKWPKFCTPSCVQECGDDCCVVGCRDGSVTVYSVPQWNVMYRIHDVLHPVSVIDVRYPQIAVGYNTVGIVSVYDLTYHCENVNLPTQRAGCYQYGVFTDETSTVACIEWYEDDCMVVASTDGSVSLVNIQQHAKLSNWRVPCTQLLSMCCTSSMIWCSTNHQHVWSLIVSSSSDGGGDREEDSILLKDERALWCVDEHNVGQRERKKRKISSSAGSNTWSLVPLVDVTECVYPLADSDASDQWWLDRAAHLSDGESLNELTRLTAATIRPPADRIVSIWGGGLRQQVVDAMDSGTLNADLVALSASLGDIEIWRRVCLRFAQQLARAGEYQRASLYYLGCGDEFVASAVSCLLSGDFVSDAAHLSLDRLGEHHPLTQSCFCVLARACELKAEFAKSVYFFKLANRPHLVAASNCRLRATKS